MSALAHGPGGEAAPARQPEAVARLLALAMMVDHSIHPREVRELDRIDAARRLGLAPGALLVLLGRCFDGQMQQVRALDRRHLVEDDCVHAALDAVDPEDRLLAYQLVVELLPADGQLADAELALLQTLLDRWHLRDIAARHTLGA